jgi:hypothetical protein
MQKPIWKVQQDLAVANTCVQREASKIEVFRTNFSKILKIIFNVTNENEGPIRVQVFFNYSTIGC